MNEINDAKILSEENPAVQPDSPYESEPMPQSQPGAMYGNQPMPQSQPGAMYGNQSMPQSQPGTMYGSQPMPQSQAGTMYKTQSPMQGQPGFVYGGQKKQKKDSMAYGITSMALGIVSVFLFACCINYITAIIAVVFGILQLVKCKKKGMAITGLVTSAISIIMSVVLWVGVIIALGREQDSLNFGIPDINNYDNYQDYLDDFFNDTLDNMPGGIEEL